MFKISMIFGVLMIVLGLVGYFGTGSQSLTALIPAVFGILLVIAGLLARKESLRMHAMHLAALVGLIGFLGGARGLVKIPQLLSGTADRPAAAITQSVLAILSIVFVVLCVRSFIDARKMREAEAAQTATE